MKNKVYQYFIFFIFLEGQGGTRCIKGDVQMANSILRASFLFIYLAFIQLFIYLLTGY